MHSKVQRHICTEANAEGVCSLSRLPVSLEPSFQFIFNYVFGTVGSGFIVGRLRVGFVVVCLVVLCLKAAGC